MNQAILRLSVLMAAMTSVSMGAELYVRSGGTCTSACSSWTNASNQISTAIGNASRGDTIWVGDGSYSSIDLNKAASGSTTITIRKATTGNHGTATGWSDTYGDGQATLPGIQAMSDYWVIDGQTRDESNWANTASYGFRVTGTVMAHTLNYGTGANNLTFQYLDVGGADSTTFNAGNPDAGFYLGGFGTVLSNWTISRSHIHNQNSVPFQIAGASNVTIEYSWLGPNWNKETIRGQIRASNITIRYNIMKDGCQGNPQDPTAGACTAQIAMWDGSAGAFDGSQIYGNVIWMTVGTAHTDGCIMVGGDGNVTAAGAAANGVGVYNNSFVGIRSGTCSIRFPGSHSGDIAQNNLWSGLGSGVSSGCSANTCSSNSIITAATQFVGSLVGNFRLTLPLAGTVLGSPFNRDLTGAVRGADGVWDIGAYEYSSGTISLLSPTILPTTINTVP